MSNHFFSLTPDKVLEAVDGVGLHTTGLCIQLNSYENRVFEIGLEEQVDGSNRVIAKFYRPNRWSLASILDEHLFTQELKDEGLPVIAPLKINSSETVSSKDHIFFALFPKKLGRMPQELFESDFLQIGGRLAQMHNIGARRIAKNRREFNAQNFGYDSLEFLSEWIWPDLKNRYLDTAYKLVDEADILLSQFSNLRIHGDCHRGNLLHDGQQFFFVDYDDFCNGPAVQDFWMLVGGEDAEQSKDLLIKGYLGLRDWDDEEWRLVPYLRALRLIHYSAWIARRWDDPAFKQIFPDFNSYLYWLEECDQLSKIDFKIFNQVF